MYHFSLAIFGAIFVSTMVFAYQGNIAMTLGFGLLTIALIIAVMGFTFLSIFHSFVVALSGIDLEASKKSLTEDSDE